MLNIADTIRNRDNLNSLLEALISADLLNTLNESGPFTLFAPDDEAFAELDPIITVDLLKDIPELNKILLYHMVNGKYSLADLTGMDSLSSREGSDIFIKTSYHEVKVNDASITFEDIECTNGMIHIIDSVILPPVVEF